MNIPAKLIFAFPSEAVNIQYSMNPISKTRDSNVFAFIPVFAQDR